MKYDHYAMNTLSSSMVILPSDGWTSRATNVLKAVDDWQILEVQGPIGQCC
jgi:hypothetical protein